ncbi:MAG TPA: N-acetyltransferase [Anaerolineales bacterium]|nr:N-acetyltransferase [Anaerolineales bacterium]
MDTSLIEFSQLTDNDIKRLAVLHHSVMHTLLSDLGLPMVLRYYQIARADQNVIGFCAVSASGDILGWALGSPYPDRINSQLRSPLAWFVLQMLRVMFTHPLVLWQLISSVLSTSNQADMKSSALELTYIGVASGQRGQGLGKKLLDAFIKASHSNGYHSVVLSVEKENSPAIALYEQAGFKIVKTISEGRYQRNRMELTLV